MRTKEQEKNYRDFLNKGYIKGSETARAKAIEKAKGGKEFEKWRSTRTGTHSKSISKKLGIPLIEK